MMGFIYLVWEMIQLLSAIIIAMGILSLGIISCYALWQYFSDYLE
jgi:hypothetical protein